MLRKELGRARAWTAGHPQEADLLLAAVVFALSLRETGATQVAAGMAIAVAPRRRWPVRCFTVACLIAAAQIILGLSASGVRELGANASDFAVVILLYTIAERSSRRASMGALAVYLVGSLVAATRWAPADSTRQDSPLFAAALGLCGMGLAAWALGDSVAYRYRRARLAAAEERAARLEAERDAHARLAAAAQREHELQERRAQAVEESAARLRRIERDLHDGAQVRLTALAMTLGEAKELLEEVPAGAASGSGTTGDRGQRGGAADDGASSSEPTRYQWGRLRILVGSAHREAKDTLTELRDLARGIHPPVLDRGLEAALLSLSEAGAVPVRLSVLTSGRSSPAINAIVYFCAAELLTNAVKHSGASSVEIKVAERSSKGGGDLTCGAGMGQDEDGGEELVMTVSDNGRGGAAVEPGGGLAGLAQRVQTVDGALTVVSPVGGPTTVTVRLPGLR